MAEGASGNGAGADADGIALLRAATEHGLDVVVGKRLSSPYGNGHTGLLLKVRANTARHQSRR